jgi:hypothetical protein
MKWTVRKFCFSCKNQDIKPKCKKCLRFSLWEAQDSILEAVKEMNLKDENTRRIGYPFLSGFLRPDPRLFLE